MQVEKFQNMQTTASGEKRASVELIDLKTLWFNTGTLCNLTCENCYIESSPKNDRLAYLTRDDIKPFLDEIKENNYGTKLIGLTGGEPFLNPNIIEILKLILNYGHEVLVLTNANRVLKRHEQSLIQLKESFGEKLKIRVSLDHFTKEVHDQERGQGGFERTTEAMQWLYQNGFNLSIASRSLIEETSSQAIEGHTQLLQELKIDINLSEKLVIFPEMQNKKDPPEITVNCWSILNKSPSQQMCATERMVVKRKGDTSPVIMPCTLLAYDENFILGKDLKSANKNVYLNHRFCAEFCVLGGASCSSIS